MKNRISCFVVTQNNYWTCLCCLLLVMFGFFYISLLFWESLLVTYKAVSSDRSEIKGWYLPPSPTKKKADILCVLALKICFSRSTKMVKVLKGRSQSDTWFFFFLCYFIPLSFALKYFLLNLMTNFKQVFFLWVLLKIYPEALQIKCCINI